MYNRLKINYIHNYPIEEGFVFRPEEYVNISARDYCEKKVYWKSFWKSRNHAKGFARQPEP